MTYQSITIDDELKLVMVDHRHARDIFNIIDYNRKQLRCWFSWVDGIRSVDDTSDSINGIILQYEAGRGANYAILFNGVLAGLIGFQPIDWPNRTAAIGYWLGEKFTGRGVVTRSVKQLMNIGFLQLNLNKIQIRCAVNNESSKAVALRVGMVYEGILREEEWLYDHFMDHAVYFMLQRDFHDKTS